MSVSASFCCEKVKNNGPWCQNMESESDCDPTYDVVPTSCEATSYCRAGTCIDNNNGICIPNSPWEACTTGGGSWDQRASSDIPQCQLGCCLIGEQAAFVTQVACESLASDVGQESNYRADITDELTCLASANPSEKGACVFANEHSQRDCEMLTREECQTAHGTAPAAQPSQQPGFLQNLFGGGAQPSETPTLEELGLSFYPGYLCSAEELNTICGPLKDTTCGEDGRVYFRDTCNQLGNVYDSSKLARNALGQWEIADANYFTYMINPDCTPADNLGNSQSATCGDCDYISGSTCKPKKIGETVDYGGFICRSLDCLDYSNEAEGFTGDVHPKHGETWCANTPGVGLITATATDTNEDGTAETVTITGGDDHTVNNLPGSSYYVRICSNGEVSIKDDCGQFRQKVCVQSNLDEREDNIFRGAVCKMTIGGFACYAQNNSADCENRDLRDCKWIETGYAFSANGLINKTETEGRTEDSSVANGICIPLYTPGFDRTSDVAGESGATCSLGDSVCVVNYSVPVGHGALTGSVSDLSLEEKKQYCKHNCQCLNRTEAEITAGEVEWQTTMNSMCTAIGDCGTKNNFIGRPGEPRQIIFIEAAAEETSE